MGEVDVGQPAHLHRPRHSSEPCRVPRPRHRDQDARADRADAGRRPRGRPDARAAADRRARAGVTTGELDAIAEDHIRSSGAVPSFKGYSTPAVPGEHLRLGQRRDRARHPRRPGARRTATSSPSTAARSSTAGTATPRSRSRSARSSDEALELMRVTEEALWRGLAAARLGGRLTDISHAVESLRPQPGPLRHRRGLRRPRHRLGDAPAAERPQLRPPRPRPPARRGHGAGGRADGRRSAARTTSLLDDDWTVATARRLAGRALRAHLHADRRGGPGC